MLDPDFALLCAVRKTPLDGPAAWGRAAGMDPTQVRRRLKRLEDAGVLRGFTAIPSAAAFGRIYTPHQFDQPDPPPLADILAVPDVAWAATTANGQTYAISYDPPGSPGPARAALEEMLGPNAASFRHSDTPNAAVLGRIDLKVLRELIIDPRVSITDLAERTGLTSKTVRKHRAELIGAHHVAIDPILRHPSGPGRLFYNLVVYADTPEHVRAVAEGIPEAVTINFFDEPPMAYLFTHAASLDEQMGQLRTIQAMPHVTDADVIVNRDYGVAKNRLVRWCEEGMEAWGKAARA